MKKFLTSSLLIFLFCSAAIAQEERNSQDSLLSMGHCYSKTYERNATFDIGYLSRYNTYLSPLLYEGTSFSLFTESIRPCEKRERFRWIIQDALRFAPMKTSLGGGGMYHIAERLAYQIHYEFKPTENFSILAGAGMSEDLYVDWSLMNSNNTAFVGFGHSFLDLAVRPTYNLKTKKRVITFYDHFTISLIKTSFSNRYTQDLYDIIYYDSNLTNWGTKAFNYADFSNHFTVKLPLKKSTLLLAHVVERQKESLFNIERRKFVNCFSIGFSYNITRTSGRYINE